MKLTLSWLRAHLDTEASLSAITDALTRLGLEVEAVEDRGAALGAFVVAAVVEAEPHPQADRLRVCRVDTGAGEPVQVVCGAPNARAGMRSVFAPPGAVIPSTGAVLGVGSIRGVESRGMLCSAAELGVAEDHAGILDLPTDAPVGAAYAAWAGLDDPVIEVAVTPNRPDALGVRGIARDLAAAGLGTLKPLADDASVPGSFPCPVAVRIEAEPRDCPAFALRLVRGVRGGPSPAWMQARLRAIGLRPISALVDITNYLTHDRARPLHVFDAGAVRGDLVIRRGAAGETLLGLDGRTHAVAGAVVVADEGGPESIGGVMGGEASGCTGNTTDVLIESALWNPADIARTGRRLNLHTDARHRFERGVDPAGCLPGLEAATRLVLEICGGEASEVVLAGSIPGHAAPIRFAYAETARLTGLALAEAEARGHLEALGFLVTPVSVGRAEVTPPTWRPDVEGSADLVEEVIRVAGLERVEPVPFPRPSGVARPVLTPAQLRLRLARRALAARGMVEAVTWSFVSRAEAEAFGGGDASLSLANPIAADLSDLRPSLLPGLVAAARRAGDRGTADLALFEAGQAFASPHEDGQRSLASGLRRGLARVGGEGRSWRGRGVVDAFDAKADALALLEALGVPPRGLSVVPGGPAWFHPGRSGTLRLGPKTTLGAFGELHPGTLADLGLRGTLVAFEIDLGALPPAKPKATRARPKPTLSAFQPVTRDFAFLIDRGAPAAEVLRAVEGAQREVALEAGVFDLYEGAGVPEGQASLAVTVTLRPADRTLTDAEIEAVSAKIVEAVAKRTGASLRG